MHILCRKRLFCGHFPSCFSLHFLPSSQMVLVIVVCTHFDHFADICVLLSKLGHNTDRGPTTAEATEKTFSVAAFVVPARWYTVTKCWFSQYGNSL